MTYPQDVHSESHLQFATPWRRYLPFIVGGVGVALIGAGVLINYINNIQSASSANDEESVESISQNGNEKANGANSVKGVNSVKLVKVDISGAVLKPGLVEIPGDSRVQDVLISAGGYDAKADRMYISRSINLAQPIQDGMKIYIPFEGEAGSSGSSFDGGTSGSSTSYNINSASQAKLEELSGVGPVTAKKIIDGRPYVALEDLVTKKVVSKSVYDKIKAAITLY